MRWQHRLFDRFLGGKIPAALDLPTGLGKTSIMAIWLLARACAEEGAKKAIPRRLVYIVDRRAVVDQATDVAVTLRDALNCNDTPESKAKHLMGLQPAEKEQAFATFRALKGCLDLADNPLPISTLRGAQVDNREWLGDPASPAIIVGTVDMIGSRLLFEGYGVSRRMRPYHAGLLGTDALIVLDEAHLVPPFASLLRSIENGASLRPEDGMPLPRFIVLPLSATQRERSAEENGRQSFGFEDEDRHDHTASRRLNARKQLRLEPLAEKDHDGQLAEAAFTLATGGRPARVVVFCDRRKKKDDGTGPSAQGVAEAIEALAKKEKIEIDPPELLVGARRVYEREQAARRLGELGFTGGAELPERRPAFLVATSAGEVGVDLDADHLVCDLVPWERLVQRLGRVNRRGGEGREAQVVVFDTSGIEKDEARKAPLVATLSLLRRIESDLGGMAGPATLLILRGQVDGQEIKKACSPEPLHPALTPALADAWSMTSLEYHTGRPDIAPWLRGWVEDTPQTVVVWREFLPLRVGDNGQAIFSSKKEINEFFDAAPPHESEKLETETYRVAEWLQGRANALLQRKPPEKAAEDVVALILSPSNEYEGYLTLGQLAADRKGRMKDEFQNKITGRTLIVDAGLGGLKDGLLNGEENNPPPTADTFRDWSKEAAFRVRAVASGDDKGKEDDWRFEDDFILRSDGDDDPAERLIVEHFRSAAQSEEGRSISSSGPQELARHQNEVAQKARNIAARIGLSGVAAETLALAALLHDEGKKAPRWQRAFQAPRARDEAGAYKVFAKTNGPIDQAILDGYRHEFGSLPHAEANAVFRDLPEEWRDLVLHLIAAHHGQARPVIGTRGCEDAPPSALEARARDVALRFAGLQKRWGPWGLAWWEALLRAADQQASRENDSRGAQAIPSSEEN